MCPPLKVVHDGLRVVGSGGCAGRNEALGGGKHLENEAVLEGFVADSRVVGDGDVTEIVAALEGALGHVSYFRHVSNLQGPAVAERRDTENLKGREINMEEVGARHHGTVSERLYVRK